MMPAVITDPFEKRTLACHLTDGAKEKFYDGIAPEATMHEHSMHGHADADRRKRVHDRKQRPFDDAETLRKCPGQAGDRPHNENSENAVAAANPDVHQDLPRGIII